MAELKFIFAGSTAAGKTTAIRTISEIPVVSSDLPATDAVARLKESTTVALDFGEITLEDGRKLHLYGTPGQQRFQHMWSVLAQGALGVVILCNHRHPDPFSDLMVYLKGFEPLIRETGAVIGVTQCDLAEQLRIEPYYEALEQFGLVLPILPIDARNADDIRMLLDILMTTLEYA